MRDSSDSPDHDDPAAPAESSYGFAPGSRLLGVGSTLVLDAAWVWALCDALEREYPAGVLAILSALAVVAIWSTAISGVTVRDIFRERASRHLP